MTEAQVDLFLDSLVDAPFRDDKSTMEFPFFGLPKTPRRTPLVYDDGRVTIRVEPGPAGMATIYDKDVLIYIASLIFDRMNKGMPLLDRTVRFAAHDFLRATRRSTSAAGYEGLKNALNRLRSTNIVTSIKAGGERDDRGFGWIEDWRIHTRVNRYGKSYAAAVEVTLGRWMFNAIVRDRRTLTINPAYFELDQGLERRLYELARKRCGRSGEWTVPFAKLADKLGSTRDLRKLKCDIKAIVGRNRLPDYKLSLEQNDGDLWIRFVPRVVSPGEGEVLPPVVGVIADIGEATYRRAALLAEGYDLDLLLRRWQKWASGQMVAPEDPDAAFLGFVREHLRRNPGA